MSTTNPSGSVPSSAPAKATPKARGSNQKLTVILHLPSSLLSRFPAIETPGRKVSRAKLALTSTSTPTLRPNDTESLQDTHREQADISAPKQDNDIDPTTPTISDAKRKGVPGPKPGTKRSASAIGEAESMPKPRGKPGPKKKPRLDGDMQANGIRGSFGGPTPISTHKLGPKANQGAINAGLRALDRTGKPCRRWKRKAFEVKSFTGITWGLPSWRTITKNSTGFSGDVNSETSGSPVAKGEPASSAVQSEKSISGGEATGAQMVNDGASSPAS